MNLINTDYLGPNKTNNFIKYSQLSGVKNKELDLLHSTIA